MSFIDKGQRVPIHWATCQMPIRVPGRTKATNWELPAGFPCDSCQHCFSGSVLAEARGRSGMWAPWTGAVGILTARLNAYPWLSVTLGQ